jgi:hypothetical protein
MFSLKQLKRAMPKQTFELFVEGFSDLKEIQNWTLVGGTALAIYYHHRLSEDLDFFIKHSTLEQSRKSLLSMMQQLEERGFNVVKIREDERNLDFEIFGVKVTFFASGIQSLKDEVQSYRCIEIATVDTIIAMKMDAIINYRTRSRDFYDIYTISKEKNSSIFEMLDIYNRYKKTKTKESELLHRFFEKKLDSNDEGLSQMRPKEQITFAKLREWVKKEIKKQRRDETEIINLLLKETSLIPKYASMFFGFERNSLLQKFASILEPNMVLESLKVAYFDISYTNISGKNILDYYVDNEKMFKAVLFYADYIPNEWMNSRFYHLKNKIPLILLENSLINCIKNASNKKRIEKVAMAREIDIDTFIKMLDTKREFLINR